jgi:hypothetical protein
MKHIIIAILAFSCIDIQPVPETGQLEQASLGNVGANPNPLTFWWWAGDGQQLRPALECALTRIRNATCLPVDVSLDAHHWVRQKPAADMGGRLGWTTGSSWDDTRISLKTEMGPQTNCRVLTHEIAQHVLQRRNDDGHVAPVFQLSATLLERICAIWPCGCFNPESDNNPLPVDEYDWECSGISQCVCAQ